MNGPKISILSLKGNPYKIKVNRLNFWAKPFNRFTVIERSVFYLILVFTWGMSLTDITDLQKLTERSVSSVAILERLLAVKAHCNEYLTVYLIKKLKF